jgi:hypothetical protein
MPEERAGEPKASARRSAPTLPLGGARIHRPLLHLRCDAALPLKRTTTSVPTYAAR